MQECLRGRPGQLQEENAKKSAFGSRICMLQTESFKNSHVYMWSTPFIFNTALLSNNSQH